jgi:uncharacterized protein YndB with AHSA1/START domain
MRFETSVEVEAAPAEVWRALTDVVRWPEATASMDSVEWVTGGEVAVGNAARIKQPGLPANVWTVTDVVAGESFTWETANPGVRTVATHVIRPGATGRSTLTLGVAASGVLAPLLGALMGGRAKRFVGMEAAGLKKQSERR